MLCRVPTARPFSLTSFTSRQVGWPFPNYVRLPVAFPLSNAYGIISKRKNREIRVIRAGNNYTFYIYMRPTYNSIARNEKNGGIVLSIERFSLPLQHERRQVSLDNQTKHYQQEN